MSITKKKFEDFMDPTKTEPAVKANEYITQVYCTNCGHGYSDSVLRVVETQGQGYDNEECPNCKMRGKLALKV